MEIAERLTGLNVGSFQEILVRNVDIPSFCRGNGGFEVTDSPHRHLLSYTDVELGDS